MLTNWWHRFKSKLAAPVPERRAALSDRLPDIYQLPLVERCIALYDGLDLQPFLSYRITDGHGRQVTVIHQNIGACIDDVTTKINIIKGLKYLPQQHGEYVQIIKPINRFFIDKEGCYLNSLYEAVFDLKTVVLELGRLVQADKDSDYYSYNLRILNSFLYVMCDFALTLNDIIQSIQSRS